MDQDFKPLVSIITPIFNRELLISKCVESVLTQSYDNWELILVDDCSTDNSFNIISNFNHPKIKVFRLNHNQERGAARNFGINKAKGELIAFLDSDDQFLENHLTTIVNTWKKSNRKNALYFTNSYIQIHNDEISKKIVPKLFGNVLDYLMYWTPNPARVAITSGILTKYKFDSTIPGLEDIDLWLRIAIEYPVVHIEEYTNIYRIHDHSYSNGDEKRFYKELNYFRYIFSKPEIKRQLPYWSKLRLISMCHFHIANTELLKGNKINSLIHSGKSILLYPKGYNKKTLKPLIVIFIYSVPIFGLFLSKIVRIIKTTK